MFSVSKGAATTVTPSDLPFFVADFSKLEKDEHEAGDSRRMRQSVFSHPDAEGMPRTDASLLLLF